MTSPRGRSVASRLDGIARSLPVNRKLWPLIWQEMFEERAALIEYDGNQPRSIAEQAAERQVREMYQQEGE